LNDSVGHADPKRRRGKVVDDAVHVGAVQIAHHRIVKSTGWDYRTVETGNRLRDTAQARCLITVRRALRSENAPQCLQTDLRLRLAARRENGGAGTRSGSAASPIWKAAGKVSLGARHSFAGNAKLSGVETTAVGGALRAARVPRLVPSRQTEGRASGRRACAGNVVARMIDGPAELPGGTSPAANYGAPAAIGNRTARSRRARGNGLADAALAVDTAAAAGFGSRARPAVDQAAAAVRHRPAIAAGRT